MKKVVFLLAIILCSVGLSSFSILPNDMTMSNDSSISIANPQDYCPTGYVCEATNCRAKGSSGASPSEISGISVYKNSKGEVIAYVPGHGHLRCWWGRNTSWGEGWQFNANSATYLIMGYNRK